MTSCRPWPSYHGLTHVPKYSNCTVCGGNWIAADGIPECPGYSPGEVLRATLGNGPWPDVPAETVLVCVCGAVVERESAHECGSADT